MQNFATLPYQMVMASHKGEIAQKSENLDYRLHKCKLQSPREDVMVTANNYDFLLSDLSLLLCVCMCVRALGIKREILLSDPD